MLTTAACTGIACASKKALLTFAGVLGVVSTSREGVTIDHMKFWPVIVTLSIIGMTIYSNSMKVIELHGHVEELEDNLIARYEEAKEEFNRYKHDNNMALIDYKEQQRDKYNEAKEEFEKYKNSHAEAQQKNLDDLEKRLMTQLEGRDFKIDSNYTKLQQGDRFTASDGKELERQLKANGEADAVSVNVINGRITRIFERLDRIEGIKQNTNP